MKKIILAAALLLSQLSQAQTAVTQDAKTGNYYATSTAKAKTADKLTGKNFVDSKGNSYPVYESGRGKLYYKRTSKTSGKEYKVYLQTEGGTGK